MQVWITAKDCNKDLETENMEKEDIYNAEYAEIWAMGWKCFEEDFLEEHIKDIQAMKDEDSISVKDHEWHMQKIANLKKIKGWGMTMADVAKGKKDEIEQEKDAQGDVAMGNVEEKDAASSSDPKRQKIETKPQSGGNKL